MELLKDQLSDIDRENDVLEQAPALDTLLTAIREIKPPACLALYGSWGSGKTSLMNSTRLELAKDAHHRVVWFDPWPYERHEDVLAMLVLSILRELRLSESKMRALAQQAAALLKVILSIVGRITPSMIAAMAGDVSAAGTLGLNRLDLDKLASHLTKPDSLEDDVKKVRKAFKDLLDQALKDRGPTSRFVVFLDDLDRCLPDRAVWLIEATKLLLADSTGDAPAVFVFGLDRQIVGEAIRVRYPGSSLYTGENYLEKIFDLSLEAPTVTTNREKLQAFLRRVGGGPALDTIHPQFCQLDELFDVLSNPAFSNPRVIKRVVNRLYLLTKDRKLPEIILAPKRRVAWVAGTERFRTFRHFFVQASDEELNALDAAVSAASGSGLGSEQSTLHNPPVAVRAFVDTPGFIGFLRDLLELRQRNEPGKDLRDQRKRSHSEQISTLRDLDDFMRSVGL